MSELLHSYTAPSQQINIAQLGPDAVERRRGVQGRLGDEDFEMSAEEATQYLQTLGSRLGEAARRLREVQRQHTVKEAELRANQQQQRQVHLHFTHYTTI